MDAILLTTTEPRWLTELRHQCAARSQAQVARELEVSGALISQVLKGKYPGDLHRIEKLVRGQYLGDTVLCPVLGELELDNCQRYQRQAGATHNPLRVQLYRACKHCEHAQEKQ
ncbi:helix-turn-helix domain-containing protein [Parathalassolituus penaei]|uniref:Helix-turn-helix transcriptional regulator n=1 Tax=Parathalassolituus penaei TaxID=2997323 RepID=A0A9X3EF82_9GAMM|nr:helix-turn-helix transcriptional regulator [Parathalassolituus penaei]MCY0966161.1 helix-turn-helix transcriptional regulator [Parathalassolituus penaei]